MPRNITLISPRDGSTTEPLQRFQHYKDLQTNGGCGSVDEADSWSPLLKNADPSAPADRSIPRPVVFEWKGTADLSYELLISRNADLADPDIRRTVSQETCPVHNLRIGTRHFWKVIGRNSNGHSSESAVWSFSTNPSTPRWILVPGITNVRDLGGWRLQDGRLVKQEMIYRSSEMNSHVNITDEGRRVLIDELGIRTDIDLRGDTEQTEPVLDQSIVKWVNFPVAPYGHIIKEAVHKHYRNLFHLLAQPATYPAVFHCWGGADRGGTVAFLIHALLGLSEADLIRDYELTSLSVWAERSHTSDDFKSLLEALWLFSHNYNDIKGQAEGYLRTIGVTDEEIASIRSLLIEDTQD